MLKLFSGATVLVTAYLAYVVIAGLHAHMMVSANRSAEDGIVLSAYVDRMPGYVAAELDVAGAIIVTSHHAPQLDSEAVVQLCSLANRLRIAVSSGGIRDPNLPGRLRYQSRCPTTAGT